MNFENKVISREIQQFLYDSNKTLGTAESCTGGRIAEVIAAVPGASNSVSYTHLTLPTICSV